MSDTELRFMLLRVHKSIADKQAKRIGTFLSLDKATGFLI